LASIRLPKDHAHAAQQFDVVGVSIKPDHINHLALLAAPASMKYGDSVPVAEMGPPLRAGQVDPLKNQLIFGNAAGHAVAWIDDLTNGERMAIEDWIQDVRTRVPADWRKCYTIDPPSDVFEDEVTHRSGMRKFSCAGFVICCYEEAINIQILDRSPESLPWVGWETIEKIYDETSLRHLRFLGKQLGLDGTGPWRFVLCGYVLHALNRTSEAIRSQPYRVSGADEAAFPSGSPPFKSLIWLWGRLAGF
jgi:hypothetical protein